MVAALVLVLAAGVAGGFLLGRTTAPTHDHAWEDSYSLGYDQGLGAGRVLQIGDTIGPGQKDAAAKAFQAGYRAGQDDAFGSYDGGWEIGTPYVVILGHGTGGSAYRFAYRVTMVKGSTYEACGTAVGVCSH
jgi:hypothetical protein